MKRTEAAEQADKTPYRKVELGTWWDEKFRALSRPQPNGQTLWMYLLTGPRTTPLPGLIVAREAVMADDLGWDLDGFRYAIADVIRDGMVDADWDAGVVVLRKALIDGSGRPRDTARPTSINQLKGWAKHIRFVPECPLKSKYLQQLKDMAYAMSDAFEDAFEDAFGDAWLKASRTQRTENREQRTVKEEMCGAPTGPAPALPLTLDPSAPSKARKPRSSALATGDYQAVVDAYHSRYEAAYGHQPTWTATHGAQLNRLLKSHSSLEVVRRLGILFSAPPKWLKGPYDFRTLVSQFDKLVQPAEAPSTVSGRVEPKSVDEYPEGEVSL